MYITRSESPQISRKMDTLLVTLNMVLWRWDKVNFTNAQKIWLKSTLGKSILTFDRKSNGSQVKRPVGAGTLNFNLPSEFLFR